MYHKAVLLKEAVEYLNIQPDGTYVDATFGSGGHSREILGQLQDGHLYAFDQDKDAAQNTIDDSRFTLIQENFRYLKNFLKLHGVSEIDGVLADLGISSWQIDRPERGFSTRFEGRLDMRMDDEQEFNAEALVNEYPEEQLASIFFLYGDIQNSRPLAGRIAAAREEKRIETTMDLVKVVQPLAPRGKENQYLARVFQAIRIEVNDELEALKDLLTQATQMLNAGGRIAIIAYHSLEDKLVKNFFNTGNFEGKTEKDFYGNLISPLKPIRRKALKPPDDELSENPRSRSAKLRAAEKK